ncbi:uncharacterized protein ACA1_159220 [Acanthamoeba castellanii str. Neff]|uniref:Uncharacterized protein n=1 Tax=Acanthamoeba castellanii (strain ATCC 30010 / Neff) TaxID=1257118 RepID=L8H9G1_ACACF|nr:uncharacterized protein ACA1_159220 [Acanthamoeba castellanii str. Neff]ELR22124.1 hypothetical protein ACA1_159220 [Acanthamoeba castellanii str. Neff]
MNAPTIKATTSPATTTSAAGARGGAATEETKLPPLASRARFLKWIVIATLVLNVALFLGIPSPRPVWLFTTDHGLPWFIYPLAVSVILCGSLYLASHNVEKPWLQLHLLVSATINFTIIFTYVFKFDRQPYFAYVLLPSAGLLCLHLLLTDHWGVMPRPHKYFYVHLVSIYVPLNLGAWAKAHELRMPSWRKEADKAPPVVTPEVGSSQPTPGSQV